MIKTKFTYKDIVVYILFFVILMNGCGSHSYYAEIYKIEGMSSDSLKKRIEEFKAYNPGINWVYASENEDSVNADSHSMHRSNYYYKLKADTVEVIYITSIHDTQKDNSHVEYMLNAVGIPYEWKLFNRGDMPLVEEDNYRRIFEQEVLDKMQLDYKREAPSYFRKISFSIDRWLRP